MRFIITAFIMVAELAAIFGVAWFGWQNPLLFAGATAALALILGSRLEVARLRHEFPFYFNRTPSLSGVFIFTAGFIEAFVKALLAGVVALLTFLGTDPERLQWVAIIFGVVLFIGCSVAHWLSTRFQARRMRWGYFRLAAPLGILFSLGIAMLPSPGLGELAGKLTFELPNRPSLAQASEFLFLIKQSFDDLIERALGTFVDPGGAQPLAALVSVNMLSGFVLALYAVLITEVVRSAEDVAFGVRAGQPQS